MAVGIFWCLMFGLVVFVALAIYGARLAKRPPSETPYGRAVVERYRRQQQAMVEKEVAETLDSLREEFYIIPKRKRR